MARPPSGPITLLDELTTLIATHCNHDKQTPPQIRQRLHDTFKTETYLVRRDAEGQVIGYLDYSISWDGLVHIRKLIALRPGLIWSMVRELRRLLPWKQVYFRRDKYVQDSKQGWRHHGKPWRACYEMA